MGDWSIILVRNIWFLSPLIPSKWENLVLLSFAIFCIFFEVSVFIFQSFNDKRVWSSWPQLGGSWQISGFPMKCFIFNFVKPLKIWAYLDNFFFIVSKGGPKEKLPKLYIGFSAYLYLIGNPEICQDPPSWGQDDQTLLFDTIITLILMIKKRPLIFSKLKQ